jgi:transmembrane sensor
MSTPPPDDRDLRLARRLDAGEAPDGSDPLHNSLYTLRPDAAATDTETADRLWARIETEIGTGSTASRPASAPDRQPLRQPLRLVRPRVMRWAVAATVLFAIGVSVWMIGRPNAVIVAASEIVTWEAPDGSTVTLRPHSRLVRLDGERAYRLEGEALFDVVPDPDAPFTVEAGPADVRVLGTRFVVSTWGERAEVFVEEGRVRVSADADALDLAEGEAAAASGTGVAALPTADATAFLDWQRGELVFERTPLRRVADEIGQQFGIAVTVPPAAASETVSGVIELTSAEQVLGDLGRILGGRFEPADGGYRFVRP